MLSSFVDTVSCIVASVDVDILCWWWYSTYLLKFLHPSLAVFYERPLAAGLGLFS